MKKGKSGEREVANLLRSALDSIRADLGLPPVDICRNLVQSRSGGCDLLGVDGYAVEVKRVENSTPGAIAGWWSQACRQATEAGSEPALCFRRNREAWKVMVQGTVAGIEMPVVITLENFIRVLAHRHAS